MDQMTPNIIDTLHTIAIGKNIILIEGSLQLVRCSWLHLERSQPRWGAALAI